MAASNESQGLKIAVAVFIALAVVLLVTCYFLYSNYSYADAQRAKAVDDLNTAKKAQDMQARQLEELRGRIGVRAEDSDAAKAEIDAHYKKINDRLEALGGQVNTAMQKVQQSGAQPQELQDLQSKVQQAIASFRSTESNRNYISSLDRETELMENMALLTTEMGINYLDLRHALESATNVTKQQVEVEKNAAAAARTDVMEEQKKHVDERGSLLAKVEAMTKDNDLKTTEIANLNDRIRQLTEDRLKEKDLLTAQIREWRDRAEKSDVILDRPDGHVTYVDYEAREVQVNINRSMGAQPQMMMAVFDSRSPGVPTDKPKGTIQLTKIGDRVSVGRIVKTMNPIEPVRAGDIVYSAAWSPNMPKRFALVGKIDVNRDGRDDRQELKRMIEEAGGVVDFDLPPAWVGKETGKLTPQIDWYVIDEREPLRDIYLAHSEPVVKMESELKQRMGEIVKEARLDGIRPMPIEKLLSYLGYDINAAVHGRTEAVNDAAIRRLTTKRQQATPGATAPAASTSAPAEEKKAEDTPKKKAEDEGGDQ